MSNQLDDFFKNKLQERTFEYDESAWEDARLLIETDERSKKKRFLFYWFAGISILMLVGISAYYLGKHTAAPDHTPTENKNSNKNDNKDTKAIANTDYNNAKPIDDSSAMSTDESLRTVNDDRALASASTDDGARSTIASLSQNNNNKNNRTTTTENNKKNSFTLNNAQGVAGTTTTTYKPTTVDTNPNIVNKATPKLYVNQENQNAGTLLEGLNNDISQLPFLNLQYFSESNEANVGLLAGLPIPQSNIEGGPIVDPSQKFYFGFRGGIGLIPLEFMDYETGIEMGYQMNRNWSVSIQPKYQYQSLNQNTIEQSEVSEFGFGLRASAFNLEAESIRSIHLPLVLSYSFGNRSLDLTDALSSRYLKNKISFGVSYVRIDGVKGTIFQNEGQGQSSVFQTGFLAKRTFNRHNAEVMIGYDRYLSERFSLGIQARYRLRDQFTDAFNQLDLDIVAPDAFYLGLQANFKIF